MIETVLKSIFNVEVRQQDECPDCGEEPTTSFKIVAFDFEEAATLAYVLIEDLGPGDELLSITYEGNVFTFEENGEVEETVV